MPDFPTTLGDPQATTLTTVGKTSLYGDYITTSNTGFAAAAVWPVANKAIFAPVWVEQPCTAFQMGVQVTTQSGNMDVGIYTVNGAKLVTKGTTAVAAAGFQAFDITDTVLTPGVYFLAMSVDNGTAAFRRMTAVNTMILQCLGIQEMATAFVLPATATFANPAATYVPFITVSLVATI